MRKIVLGVIALATLITLLSAGVLTGSDIKGTKTWCYYSDGAIIVIDGVGICPATN